MRTLGIISPFDQPFGPKKLYWNSHSVSIFRKWAKGKFLALNSLMQSLLVIFPLDFWFSFRFRKWARHKFQTYGNLGPNFPFDFTFSQNFLYWIHTVSHSENELRFKGKFLPLNRRVQPLVLIFLLDFTFSFSIRNGAKHKSVKLFLHWGNKKLKLNINELLYLWYAHRLLLLAARQWEDLLHTKVNLNKSP